MRVTPRHSIDQVQIVPPFGFTATQMEQIVTALPSICGKQSVFIAGLERCARSFLWLHNQYCTRATRAEQNAALAEIGELARNLAKQLDWLDMEVEWALLDSAALPVDCLPEFTERLEILADAAERTLHVGKQKSGPRRNPSIDRMMPTLKHLYEQYTGEEFSHNPKQKTEYLGRPQSAAGRYVMAFFQAVDPSVTETEVCTAMATVVRAKVPRSS